MLPSYHNNSTPAVRPQHLVRIAGFAVPTHASTWRILKGVSRVFGFLVLVCYNDLILPKWDWKRLRKGRTDHGNVPKHFASLTHRKDGARNTKPGSNRSKTQIFDFSRSACYYVTDFRNWLWMRGLGWSRVDQKHLTVRIAFYWDVVNFQSRSIMHSLLKLGTNSIVFFASCHFRAHMKADTEKPNTWGGGRNKMCHRAHTDQSIGKNVILYARKCDDRL